MSVDIKDIIEFQESKINFVVNQHRSTHFNTNLYPEGVVTPLDHIRIFANHEDITAHCDINPQLNRITIPLGLNGPVNILYPTISSILSPALGTVEEKQKDWKHPLSNFKKKKSVKQSKLLQNLIKKC